MQKDIIKFTKKRVPKTYPPRPLEPTQNQALGQAANLADDTLDDFAVDVGQAVVAALKTVGELLVVDAH